MALVDGFDQSKITVKKDELLEAIRKNRAGHAGTFEKAQVGYRAAVIRELDRMLDDAKSGRHIRREIELVEPVEHTKDYDRVIRMLEMSTAETITVTERQFAQYVLDEWGWMTDFVTSTAGYAR